MGGRGGAARQSGSWGGQGRKGGSWAPANLPAQHPQLVLSWHRGSAPPAQGLWIGTTSISTWVIVSWPLQAGAAGNSVPSLKRGAQQLLYTPCLVPSPIVTPRSPCLTPPSCPMPPDGHSLPRYVAVVYSSTVGQKRTLRCAALINAGVWASSLVMATPAMLYAQVQRENQKELCLMDLPGPSSLCWYMRYQSRAPFLRPLLVITVLYSLTLHHLLQAMGRAQRCCSARSRPVTQMALTIIAAFLICWTPFHAVQLVNLTAAPSAASFYLNQLTICLSYAHSCVSPVFVLFCTEFFCERVAHSRWGWGTGCWGQGLTMGLGWGLWGMMPQVCSWLHQAPYRVGQELPSLPTYLSFACDSTPAFSPPSWAMPPTQLRPTPVQR